MSDLTQREKDLGYCEEAQTYCSVAEERYKQGREYAIYEFFNALINDGKVSAMRVLKIKEQLKEKTE